MEFCNEPHGKLNNKPSMITFFCPASSFNLRFNILRLSNLASNMYSRLFTAPSATSQRCDTPFWAAFWLVQIQNTEQDAMSDKNSPIRGFNSLCWQDDALKITKPLNQFDYVRSGFCRLWKKAIKKRELPREHRSIPEFDSADWRTEFKVLLSNNGGASKSGAIIFRVVSSYCCNQYSKMRMFTKKNLTSLWASDSEKRLDIFLCEHSNL